MELKHVFFSSLLLSATFTACTNEEFTTEISAPVTVEDAISLGEGYTIVGSKMGDAASRAYVTGDLKSALWEKTDVIGAAWYNMATLDGNGKWTGQEFTGKVFASNTWFKWNKQIGEDMSTAEFKSDANAMAGAYVLYYPYDETITSSFAGIPVEVAYNQTMDCTEGKELDFINDNLFSYCVYPFVPGGIQTADFEMKQLTNVFALTFQVDKPNLMTLEKPVKIAKVIVEAKASAATVLNTKGLVKAPECTVDYEKGNYGTTKYTSGIEEDTKTDHLILDVKNATDAYSIKALETPTEKPFYITALPFSEDADVFTVKILTEDGKVYSKTFGTEALAAVNKVAVKEGQIIRLNVVLDDLSDEGTIYTADQFKTQWDAALKSDEATILTIGEGVDLSDMDLNVNANVNITLAGKSAKVKSLNVGNGSLTINNELSVAGDVTIGSNAKGFTTNGTTAGTIAVDGKVSVQGTAGNVKFSKIGSLDVDASGIIAIEGAMDGNEYVSEIGTITNEGNLTLKTVSVKTLSNTATGTVTLGDAKVINEGTFTNKGKFEIGTYEFNNNGSFSQEGTISGTKATFNNNAGATLDVKASTTLSSVKIDNKAADAEKNLAAAVINVSKDVTLNAKNNTNGTITNNGIINVTGTLTEGAEKTLSQTNKNACINVSNEGTINFNITTGVSAGYVKLSKDSKVTNSCEVLAQEVTNNTVAKDINSNAAIIITSGDINKTALITAIVNKDVVFNSGTITFTDATTFSEAIEVNGNVKFVSGAAVDVTLKKASTIKANSTLTIGNNITLKGNSSSVTTVTLENGAVLKTDGTGNIERGNSYGDIKVTYGN